MVAEALEMDSFWPKNHFFTIITPKPAYIQWCPIKVRDFHQNESCPSCPHPPSSYEERREQGRQLSF